MNRPSLAAPIPGDALLIVDVQVDLLPGGARAVPQGDAVLPVLEIWITRFVDAGQPVFASRNWHPPDHCSFVDQGGPWPPHCVAGTPGAAFALKLPDGAVIVSKAQRADETSWSAFAGTGLSGELRAHGVRRLFVGGLPTDDCVLFTVRDALADGFAVLLLEDATRPIDRHPGDGAAALAAMRERGASLLREVH